MGPHRVVVMGVCGSGKSTVGQRLAQQLGTDFLEGDDLHPAQNVARMAAGIALNDADRQGWLKKLARQLAAAHKEGRGLVASCSALRRPYRDILRSGAPDLQFVYLHGDRDLFAARLAVRAGHYMPASLLDSQLAALEVPSADENALTIEASQFPDAIVAAIAAYLSRTYSMNAST